MLCLINARDTWQQTRWRCVFAFSTLDAIAASSTSLTCKTRHGQRLLPRMQQQAGGGFYMAFRLCSRHHHHCWHNPTFLALVTCGNNKQTSALRLFNSIMRARLCTFLTSQPSMVLSIDTCIAAVRFFGRFWSPICPQVGVSWLSVIHQLLSG